MINRNGNSNATPGKLQFARKDLVEQLDRDIERGEVLNLIELCDDLRRDLLRRTEDDRLLDQELEEYQEYFRELNTVRNVIFFLKRLNRYGPVSELEEARRRLEKEFGKEAGSWLK